MWMTGMANAAVLPVPVCAIAITSSPFSTEGMALNCMSVGRLNPNSSKLFKILGDIGYCSNFMRCQGLNAGAQNAKVEPEVDMLFLAQFQGNSKGIIVFST
jgi:hypothetical protein